MLEKITSTVKEVLGERHDITNSFREGLSERLSSPFYGYFLISWLIVNWDFLYSAFFVDGEKIYEKTGLLKNEYLLQRILPEHYISIEYWWTFLVLPLIITFVALWPMQFFTRIIYKRHIKNKIADENIKINALAAKAEAESKKIKAETAVFKAEVAQAKIEKEAEKISPEINWRKEYDEFKKTNLYEKFQAIIDHYYQYNGLIDYSHKDGWTRYVIDQDILVYSDVNGLITISGNTFTITKKGKEFVKLYNFDTSQKS